MGLTLTADQRLAVEERQGPLLVSAAAGAGKTRVLVERLLARVRQGADIDRFLVITFTNAAAAELRQRVRDELNAALASQPGDRHLRRQLTLVYQAQISTIHAFCGQLLRQWGYLLDIEADYRLCDEGEGELLLREALTELLERRYEAPTGDFALLLDVFSAGRDDQALVEMTLDIYRKLQSHSDPRGWLERQQNAFDMSRYADVAQTPWGAYLLERLRELAGYWYDQLAPVLEECRAGVPPYCASLEVTLANLSALTRAETWDEAMPPEFPALGRMKKDDDPVLAQRVKALRDGCKTQLGRWEEALLRDSASLLDDIRLVAPAAQALLGLVGELSERYQALKAKRGVLDFNDLEHRTLELLTACPQAAWECAQGFEEVMVDEYQDTNQVQNAIFDALTKDRGNLFMVGDVKQSIYRFRLADPTIFLEKYRAYPPCAQAQEGQGHRVVLGENFRSRSEVIDCVNFLFSNLMSREVGELDYGADEALHAGGSFPPRSDCAAELHLIANPKEESEETGDSAMTEPRFVARRLRRMLDEGFPVSDGQGGQRAVEPGDMAILLRAPGGVLGRYVQALREQGIPWASEGDEDFFDAPESAVALSYLEIIDNPRQDVPLIAVLRSPLYGFSPDRLAQLRAQKGEGCYYDALTRDGGQDCRDFLAQLHDLRELARDKRSYELIWELYCRTGLLSLYCAMPGGESRREHLLALYGYARRYEAGGHKGLFGFLDHLRQRRERGERFTVPGGEGGNGVHILSIHRSKGLEFPVVVVSALGKQFNRMDAQAPMLFHRELGLGPQGLDTDRLIRYPTLCRWAVAEKLTEEMRSEELRLLYVALTRAREKLILTCAMRDPEREVGKLMEQARLPVPPQALAHMPTVGHWILCAALCRPEAGAIRMGMPPVHVSPAEAWYGQEWIITLQNGGDIGKPTTAPGRVTDAPERPAEKLPDYTWRYPWAAACDLPSKLTATQLKGRALDTEVEEETRPAPRSVIFDRPDFALEKGLTPGERGTAHHLVMQYLDFARTGSLGELEEEIRRLVEERFITPQQGAAVDPRVLLDFFRAPLGQEALAAGEGLHREFKFSLLEPAERYWPELDEGETVLMQGVVDCWFDTPEGLVILDFKSDRVTEATLAGRREEYRPQLEAYAQALGQLLGRPVARKILWFFSLSRGVEL